MSSIFAAGARTEPAEALRRSFAVAWGEIGAAWGVAPSTAAVQGYLLVSDGPLSEPEVRRALGMSHRAASMALAQCEVWGLVERASLPRRSAKRGPAATAWTMLGDHCEWLRLVAIARQQRGDARSIERLFAALYTLDAPTVSRLWALLGDLEADEMARAMALLSELPPAAARRLMALADQPVLRRLIGLA